MCRRVRRCSTTQPRNMSNSITVRCFAKVNLQLRVGPLRDDGFHELETVFQSIDLHDILHVKSTAGGMMLTCDSDRVPTREDNLVTRAAREFFRRAGFELGLDMRLEKRIPVAAGLGGGSSDAAATLLALNELTGRALKNGQLEDAAASLGSDVPFFLLGGTALGRGRGELLTPLEAQPAEKLLLLAPPLEVSAKEAYRHFDLTFGRSISHSTQRLPGGRLCFPGAPWYNDLEGGVFAAHPELAELKRELLSAGAADAVMSGSGPVIVARFGVAEEADRVADLFRAKGVRAILCNSLNAEDYKRKFIIDLRLRA